MISSKIESAVGTITLNYEAKRNALSEALVNAEIAALAEFTQLGVRCAVLRAVPGV